MKRTKQQKLHDALQAIEQICSIYLDSDKEAVVLKLSAKEMKELFGDKKKGTVSLEPGSLRDKPKK